MYALNIGNKLIDLLNKEDNTELTAKDFFVQKYFPLFYDHPKYFQWSINSPFVQGYKSANPPVKKEREKKLQELHKKIDKGQYDGSIAIGFGAFDDDATTSGQITSFDLPISAESVYSSWIGAGLGIGVSGGLVLLIDKNEILKILFEGWNSYRTLLNETNHLKGNQIDTWNGQWLYFALTNRDYKRQKFDPTEVKKDGASIPTQNWIKVLFALARKYPNEKINAYIYSLGQTNKTIGFIQINLPEIKREIDMYNYLFSEIKDLGKKIIDDVYDTQYGLRTVCQNGTIGLKEIQPKNLRDYFQRKNKESVFNKFKINEKNIINYNIYLSWVIAMLNNKTSLQAAEDIAKVLKSLNVSNERAKKIVSNKIKALLESHSRKVFITNLTEIMKDDQSNSDFYNTLVEEIDKMQADKFPYFLTLINFKYAYLTNNNLKEN